MDKGLKRLANWVGNGGWKELLSFAIDCCPILGNVKAGFECVFGFDPITGRKLEPGERAVALAGILGGPLVKLGGRAAKGALNAYDASKGGKNLATSLAQGAKDFATNLAKGTSDLYDNFVYKASEKIDSLYFYDRAGLDKTQKNFNNALESIRNPAYRVKASGAGGGGQDVDIKMFKTNGTNGTNGTKDIQVYGYEVVKSNGKADYSVLKQLKNDIQNNKFNDAQLVDIRKRMRALGLEDDYDNALKEIDFGKYYKERVGDSPEGMYDPHTHHIVFKKGVVKDNKN